MARGINKVIIVGNLGNDPEVRYTQAGAAITNISVATTESWKDKQTGESQERTEWHRIVFFNRLAEIASQYLKKGSQVYIEGALRTRKWQDQSGADRYTTEIVANELQMLGGRNGGDMAYAPPSQSGTGMQQQPAQQVYAPQQQQQPMQQQAYGSSMPSQPAQQSMHQQPAQAQTQQQPQSPPPQPAPAMSDFDDDIPF